MKRRYLLILSACLLIDLALAASVASAQVPATSTQGRSGNYCVECHVAGDPRLATAWQWQGGVEREQVSPCPTLKKLREEIYYTESLLGAADHSGQGLQAAGIQTAPLDKRILARLETYARWSEEDVTALAPVQTETASLRYQLSKTFGQMYDGWDSVTTRWALAAAGLVTLLLGGTAVWRLVRSRARTVPAGAPWQWGISGWAAGSVILVFLIFALPVFSTAPPASTAQTAEQARRQEALNTASKAAQAAETASARVWMLARIGASWSGSDKAKGQDALTAALQAADEFEMNAPAYWGRVQALQESAATWPVAQEAATDAAGRIAVAASRAWAWRAMAGEWAIADPALAEALLSKAQAVAMKNPNAYYRDVDLYGVGVEWARLDVAKGLGIARDIRDPALRSWALRDIGMLQAKADPASAATTYSLALEAAQNVVLPAGRAWSLQELAAAWAQMDPARGAVIFEQARQAALQVQSAQDRAYVLRNLVAAWAPSNSTSAGHVAAGIEPTFPAAQASALLQVALRLPDSQRGEGCAAALQAAGRIEAGHWRDVAMAAIARDCARSAPDRALEAAGSIGDVLLGAEVQSAAAIGLAGSAPDRALELANGIPVPYLKAQTLVRVGQRWAGVDRARADVAFQEALGLADSLQDTYPIYELAVAWARLDPSLGLQAVDKIQRDVDRAAALREISVALAAADKVQAEAVFDRALAAARAMRRSGDPFASAEALRQLGGAWASINPAKAALAFEAAMEAAERVSVKY